MTGKVSIRQTHTIITLFLSAYKKKYGADPRNFNRHRDKWGFQSMIEDLGMDRAKEVIDYYLQLNRYGHPTAYLFNNYDRLNEVMIERERDEVNRQNLRDQSRRAVEEWRSKGGK